MTARRLRLSIAATSVVVTCLVGSGRAHAQSAEAEALFNDGNRLMRQGKLAEACEAFEASNRVEPRAGTLIRLGECREQNHQLASAWSAFKDALTRVKDPRKRKFASARASALEPRLSYLTVSVSDDRANRIEGLALTRNGKVIDSMLWNRALPVDGGDYVIAGRAPGRQDWQTTARVPVEGAKITVEVPALDEIRAPAPGPGQPPVTTSRPPGAPAAPPGAPAAPPSSPMRITGDVPSAGTFTARRKVAIGAAAVGAVALVSGAWLGQSAKAKQDDAFALCPTPATPCDHARQANTLMSAAHDRALAANIAFAVSAAAAIGAGVLWFTGAPRPESPRHVGLVPASSGASVIVVGRF